MNSANPQPNATPAYENAHIVAQTLVKRIGELLFDMPAPDERIHWGHVGTLNEINNQLSRIVAFLEGTAD